MKQPGIKAYLTLEILNSAGKRVGRTQKMVSRSFLLQMIVMIRLQMDPGANHFITETDGTIRIGLDGAIQMNAVASGTTRGLVVGTGTTPVNVEDFNLETLIANGSGAGELQYLAQTILPTVVSADPSAFFTITRDFLNSSGGLITVSEVGLITDADSTAATIQVLAIRDVPATPSQLFDGQNLRLTYTLQINI